MIQDKLLNAMNTFANIKTAAETEQIKKEQSNKNAEELAKHPELLTEAELAKRYSDKSIATALNKMYYSEHPWGSKEKGAEDFRTWLDRQVAERKISEENANRYGLFMKMQSGIDYSDLKNELKKDLLNEKGVNDNE